MSLLNTFVYVYWCPTRFPYRMMFLLFNSNTTVSLVEQELLTLPKHLSSPRILCGSCCFFCSVWLIIILCLLVIVLFILLRFTASDYILNNRIFNKLFMLRSDFNLIVASLTVPLFLVTVQNLR